MRSPACFSLTLAAAALGVGAQLGEFVTETREPILQQHVPKHIPEYNLLYSNNC